MKKFLKWTGFVVGGVAVLVLVILVYLYVASERQVNRRFDVATPPPLAIPTDAESIAEGKHLAQLTGCVDCHGENLAGRVVDDIPNLIRLVAPNISTMLPEYSDAELIALLRTGVKRDGTTVLLMPSEMFRHLRDEDLARVIAFLRTIPPSPGIEEKTKLRLVGRALIATGQIKLGADSIRSLPPADHGPDPGDPVNRGRYLVMNLCSECHGQDLGGFAPINAPGLVVAKGYTADQFGRLMREGVGLGDRELRFMGFVAQARFRHLREDELSDMYAFLQARAP